MSRDDNNALLALHPDRDPRAISVHETPCFDHGYAMEKATLEHVNRFRASRFLRLGIKIGKMVTY